MLHRSSTVDELTTALADEILRGELPPGTRLREDEFAQRFDVSRNSLREALHRLAHEGLVEHRPHRGVSVARPSSADAAELFRIRLTLEPQGLRVADGACAEELASIARAMEDAAERGQWETLVERDLAFHARIVSALDSPRIDAFYASVLRELRLTFVRIDRSEARLDGPSHPPDHARIARDLARGNVERAVTRLQAHLVAARGMVLEHLGGGSSERARGEAR